MVKAPTSLGCMVHFPTRVVLFFHLRGSLQSLLSFTSMIQLMLSTFRWQIGGTPSSIITLWSLFRICSTTITLPSRCRNRLISSPETCLQSSSARLVFALMRAVTITTATFLLLPPMRLLLSFLMMVTSQRESMTLFSTADMGLPFSADDTQPGNPNKTPKMSQFSITRVRGRLRGG
jgi:hypothetical protein